MERLFGGYTMKIRNGAKFYDPVVVVATSKSEAENAVIKNLYVTDGRVKYSYFEVHLQEANYSQIDCVWQSHQGESDVVN